MSEFTTRQRQVIETVLIGIGLLACLLYWWHNGELITPDYILFGMAAAAGYVGIMLHVRQRDAEVSADVAGPVLMLSIIALAFAVVTAVHQHIAAAYFVFAAYTIVFFPVELNCYITRRRRHHLSR